MKLLSFIYALFLLTFPSNEYYDIVVDVENLSPIEGNIQIGLYEGEEGFMYKENTYSNTIVTVTGEKTSYRLEKIPKGSYAICVFHDANKNGYLDKNVIGIPKEGFGFSNNPGCRFGPPKYKHCQFELNRNISLTIKMKNL